MQWRISSIEFGGRAALNGTFEYQRSPGSARDIAYRAWLLESGDRRVLVDTGPPPGEAAARGMSIAHSLAELIPAETLSGITDVVLTHGHWDHMGNLRDVPSARVWLQATEWEFIASGYLRFGAVGDYYGSTDALHRAHREGRLSLVDGAGEVAPGIRYVWTGGHTPGHQVVLVDAPEGLAVMCGDLIPVADNMRNATAPGVFTNLLQVIDGIEHIKKLDPAVLYTGHDLGPVPVTMSSLQIK